ncbi:MAG TPA: PP2C family protein-serine/threonine phosphatase, partial [Actinopolymorphaceae bacterium]
TDGKVAWLLLREEDVTAYVRAGDSGTRPPEPESPDRDAVRGELYMRARELERVNEELQQAHTREQQVAITLQEAMLAAPDLERHSNIAVRYLPAARSLHVCGDWYDLIDLDDNRFMVTVGDVVGYGLKAAAVMGILRSALSAANRALERPQAALEVMGRHVQSFEDAVSTTAVTVLVDRQNRVITYSSAGHPPPILLHADGSCELLDQATDPPLGARPDPAVPRPQANLGYRPGDTLLLYTDGLVERRDEDIDVGLNRLIDILGESTGLSPDELADTVLERLGVSDGTDDDIALITVGL